MSAGRFLGGAIAALLLFFLAHWAHDPSGKIRAHDQQNNEANARAAQRQAERDAAMEPLREAVEAEVVRTELVSARELASLPPLPDERKSIFLVTVSVHNLTHRTIVGVEGALEAHDRDSVLPLRLCSVDLGPTRIEPASRIEFRCGNRDQLLDAKELAFMNNSSGRFQVTWEPRRVKFDDGAELRSGR